MNLAIMQPYFFPYLGYWSLLAAADKWVFFDTPQYNKKSWMNRNRVLHFDKGKEFSYISVPVREHDRGTAIKDVRVQEDVAWRESMLGKLTVYKKLKAPYYADVCDLVENSLRFEEGTLIELIERTFVSVCKYIGLRREYAFVSRTEYAPEGNLEPGEWALSISKFIGASHYINPVGGVGIFNPEIYAANGIDIKFLRVHLRPYKQSWRSPFTPGLSIIDALMFLSPEEVLHRVQRDYELISHAEALRWTRDL